MRSLVVFLALFALYARAWTPLHPIHDLQHMSTVLQHSGSSLFRKTVDSYQQALSEHPLVTKMLTGGTLATAGDAIAQSQQPQTDYDLRRAISFTTFDMSYRALQHAAFPFLVANLHGQYLGTLVDSILTDYAAAMEQTLASQLGIVPFLYYPVFYSLTAFVQNLPSDAAWQRAKETFVPLMKRNLAFWIPVQFIQFGFVDEQLQIPFLSAADLCWTFILSVYAGSTKSYGDGQKSIDTTVTSKTNEEADTNVRLNGSTVSS